MTAAPSVYDVQDRVTDLRTELIHEQCCPQVAKGTAEGGPRFSRRRDTSCPVAEAGQ